MPVLRIRRDGQKSVAQTIVEIEDVDEVLPAIAARFLHLANIDQIENDLAEIAGRMYAPLIEHISRQHAVLLDRILANGFAELLPRDMAFFFHRGRVSRWHAAYAELFLCKPQSFEDKKVRIAMITAIASQ